MRISVKKLTTVDVIKAFRTIRCVIINHNNITYLKNKTTIEVFVYLGFIDGFSVHNAGGNEHSSIM